MATKNSKTSQAEVEDRLNKLVDDRVKKILSQYQLPTFKCGVVDSINSSDHTVNLKLAGQTTVTNGYANYTNCDLSIGDSVWICSINGKNTDITNAFVAYRFSATPPKIGFSGAYLDYLNGLVCTKSDGSGRILANGAVGFATYKSDGAGGWTQTGGLDSSGNLFSNKLSTLGSPVYGVIGHDPTNGDGLFLYAPDGGVTKFFPKSGNGVGILNALNNATFYLDNDDISLYWMNPNLSSNASRIWLSDSSVHFWTQSSSGARGDMYITPTSMTFSGSKSCVQDTIDYGKRIFYSYEMGDVCLGDHGRDTIKNGVCQIIIDKIFAECVNLNIDYDVYITKYGKGDIWVSDMQPNNFTVSGDDISFAWELKAKRIGFEDKRLEIFEQPQQSI